jgi:hypothetical protein
MIFVLSPDPRPEIKYKMPKVKPQDKPSGDAYIILIEQVQADLHEIKVDIREIRVGNKSDQMELWKAMKALSGSIVGNGNEGLVVRVDRNTNFRKNLTRILWALFSPLYAALLLLLFKTLFNN